MTTLQLTSDTGACDVGGANASSASDAVSAAGGAALGIYGENAVTWGLAKS